MKAEDLSQYSKKKVVYVKEQPAFLVSWLKTQLATLLKEKETFMTGFVGDIVPSSFNLEFREEEKQVEVKMAFIIDE